MLSLFRRNKKSARIGLMVSDYAVIAILINGKAMEQPQLRVLVNEAISPERTLEHCLNAFGELIKKESLVGASCHCVLHGKDYQLLLLENPSVPEEELREAVRWKIKDLIDSDIDKVAVDVFHQPDKNMIYTVVAQKNTH